MAKSSLRIFLFDVDGVIVNPIAYRLGITKTLEELCHQISLQNTSEILPTEAEISALEARGVHDVWDITNIIFAVILTEIALHTGSTASYSQNLLNPKDDTISQLGALKALSPKVTRPNYYELANLVTSEILSTPVNCEQISEISTHPPDIALKALSARLDTLTRLDATAYGASWKELLSRFLVGTRSAYESYGTRLFQNIILGDDSFQSTYGLKPDRFPDGAAAGPGRSSVTGNSIGGSSGLLRTADKTLIAYETVRTLNMLAATNSGDSKNVIGVYTARPSLPPKAVAADSLGYSPEAEIALENAGMQNFPLIGMGMMEWLGKKYNARTEDLTKPNTTQAFAALINTVNGGNDILALEDAFAVDKFNKTIDSTDLKELFNKRVTVCVFEDTISGILPLKKVVEVLNVAGYDVNLVASGIATDSQKRSALAPHCSGVYEDVNQAFQSVTNSTGIALADRRLQ